MSDGPARTSIGRRLRTVPADLVTVLALVGLTALAVFVPGVRETPLRIVSGLAFGLFAPGYALVAVLYPEPARRPLPTVETGRRRGGSTASNGWPSRSH